MIAMSMSMWLWSFLAPQVQQSCCPDISPAPPTCIGAWEGPYELQVSCDPGSLPGSDCTRCDDIEWDEIGHAALIPVGKYAGQVLFWTACDYPAVNSQTLGYRTHIWNPAAPAVPPTAHPLIAGVISNSTSVNKTDDGPFCSGHVWILDQDKKPKLLVVGGNDRRLDLETPCRDYQGAHNSIDLSTDWPTSCGVNKAYWFDPDPDPLDPQEEPIWSDDPPDLPYGLWYPSAIAYRKAGENRFHPIVLGGSEVWFDGCGMGPDRFPNDPNYPADPEGYHHHQFNEYWKWPVFGQGWESSADSIYRWHQYPRAFQLAGGTILIAGSTVICESGGASFSPYDEWLDLDRALPYGNPAGPTASHPAAPDYGGQNPVRKITNVGEPNEALGEGTDPNASGVTVGGWNYNNAVILHTLKDKYEDDLGYPTDFASHYNLNRVIALNGITDGRYRWIENVDPGYRPALREVREYKSDGTWKTKMLATTGREYGTVVVLPDGTLLSSGGQNQHDVDDITKLSIASYLGNAEVFDPLLPTGIGFWKTVASRNNALGAAVATPRAYHSVGFLVKSGNVVLMGGRFDPDIKDLQDQAINTLDTVEIYHPSYTYCIQRPQITSATPLPEMRYGTPYTIKVNNRSRVDYACLMGVGSVTHHFDYGQRYVELMVRDGVAADEVVILPPTEGMAAMAPEGYYMLFVVDVRNHPTQERIPSVQGEFVKLTFNP